MRVEIISTLRVGDGGLSVTRIDGYCLCRGWQTVKFAFAVRIRAKAMLIWARLIQRIMLAKLGGTGRFQVERRSFEKEMAITLGIWLSALWLPETTRYRTFF